MTTCLSPVSQSANSDLEKSPAIPYQVAVQVQYLHLEAEIESLLYQLESLNKKRLATTSKDI
jgi:hypothetical protein